jgi:dipeptidyl aminopeptidase/acylaminoacyl peptidase
MLYAYNSVDPRIKAVANWAGVTDFTFADESYASAIGPNLAEVAYRLTGYPIKNEFKSKFEAVSPFYVLKSSAGKPTLNVLPENNFVAGLPDASKLQYDAITALLSQKQVANKLVVLAGADHSFSMPGNADIVINETDAFFSENLKQAQ